MYLRIKTLLIYIGFIIILTGEFLILYFASQKDVTAAFTFGYSILLIGCVIFAKGDLNE
jgi:hypothetical protein